MKRLVFGFVLAASFFVGCSSYFGVIRHSTIESLDVPGSLDRMEFYVYVPFSIALDKVNLSSGTEYRLEITYDGQSWLFLDGSVVITADDKVIKISDPNPARTPGENLNVREVVRAKIGADGIAAMAHASALRIQFYVYPVTIDDQGRAALRNFYKTLVAKD